MLLHLHFATPWQWVVGNYVLAWKNVFQFGFLPFRSKMIELKAIPFPVWPKSDFDACLLTSPFGCSNYDVFTTFFDLEVHCVFGTVKSIN